MSLCFSSSPLQKRAAQDRLQLPVSHLALSVTNSSVGLIHASTNEYLDAGEAQTHINFHLRILLVRNVSTSSFLLCFYIIFSLLCVC